MTGQLLIDGVDAYTSFGVYVERQGWNGLLSFPPLKEPDKNEWQEYDGREVDLSDPVLNTREIQMSLACQGSGYTSFLSALGGGKAYHIVTALGRQFKLRLVQQPSLTMAEANTLSKLTLKFADDFPLDRSKATYVAPNGSVIWTQGYTLGNRNLSEYGITVLSGTEAELRRSGDVKPNLLVNIGSAVGVRYDDDTVRYKSRDVRLNCLMRSASLTQMWRNLDALLFDLIRPGLRTLNGLDCYYKSMAVSEFYPEGWPWLKFSLTFCMTGGV